MQSQPVAIGKQLVKQIQDDEVPDRAAGLAYRFLFAIFPFAIFLAALAGFIAPVLGMGDPTDEILVAPLEPGIADVGLVFLAHAPPGITPARLAEPGTLERSEGAQTIIVGYGTTAPRDRTAQFDAALWDGKRRIRTSTLRRVVDETWGLWSIPSYVCNGDSGGPALDERDHSLFGIVSWTSRTDGEPVCGFVSGIIPLVRYRHWISDTAAKLGSPLEP